MAGEITKPHDHLFRSVFRDESEAAALLRAHLPEPVAGAVRWSSLARQDVTFIDDRLRDSESDLLFAVRRKTDGAPAWLYVLLEHQSKPDPWLRLRLLKYSVRIWERDRRRHPDDKLLRPIVPLVLYQGRYRWREPAEFSALFAEAVRAWPGVPRYAHLLIDQTRVAPEQMHGDLHGRSVQHALLAAYRKSWPILQRLVPLLAELGRAGRVEDVRQIVVYIAPTTREKKRWQRFADTVRRQVPGGEELMNEATAEMLQIYREVKEQEVRQEGELRGKLQVIKGLLDRDVPWSTIAAATGIDQTRFRQLKQQLEAAPDGLSSSN